MKRLIVQLLGILLLAQLVACGGGESDTGQVNTTPGNGTDYSIVWNYDVGGETYIYYSSAALSEDEQTIYVGTSRKGGHTQSPINNLFAINRDGTKKWQYSIIQGKVRSTPLVAFGKVCFLADYDHGLDNTKSKTEAICLNEQNGELAWRHTVSINSSAAPIGLSTPAAHDHKLYVVMDRVQIFDIDSGELTYAAAESLSNTYHNRDEYISPIIHPNGKLYFLLYGQLFTVDTNNPQATTYGRYILAGDGFCSAVSTPAIDSEGNLYFGCENGFVVSTDQLGEMRWAYSHHAAGADFRSSPAIDEFTGQVYIGIKGNELGKMVALNIADGTLAWDYPIGKDIYSSPAIDTEGRIYFGSEAKKLHVLNADGTLAGEIATGQDITWSSPAIDSTGILYIGGMGSNGSGHGKLLAIDTKSGGLMSGPWPKIHGNNRNTGQAE